MIKIKNVKPDYGQNENLKEDNQHNLLSDVRHGERFDDAQNPFCPSIDQRLLWLKLVNVFFWGGTAFVRPYCVNFLHALGLTTQETAVVVGAVPLAGLVTGPLVGMLADKFNAHRRLLIVCLCIWIGGFQGMANVAPRMKKESRRNETDVAWDSSEVSSLPSWSSDSTFWMALIAYLIIEASFPPSIALVDTLVFAALGPERRSAYGRQRLCGTLGFMCFSLLGGVSFNHFAGIGESFRYRVHAALALVVVTFLALFWVPSVERTVVEATLEIDEESDSRQLDDTDKFLEEAEETDEPDSKKSSSDKSSSRKDQLVVTRRLSKLISVPTILLVGSILTFGTLHGMWGGYYCLFLEKVIGASQSQMGATYAVATLGETVAMFFSGFLHLKLGYEKCLVVVYLGYIVRYSSYYFLTSPWLSLLIDSLHTLTFGLMWTTAATFANAIAPADCVATLQALISGIFNSLGRALGSSLGGVIIHHFGYRLTFLSAAFVALVFGTIFTVAVIVRSVGKKKSAADVPS